MKTKRIKRTCNTITFGCCDVVVIGDKVSVDNVQGQIAEAIWDADYGMMDFKGVGSFADMESLIGKEWQRLRDAVEAALERKNG